MSAEKRGHLWGTVIALLAMALFFVLSLLMGSGGDDLSSYEKELPNTPEVTEQGRKYYNQSCAECHGDDATGDEGPDLHRFKKSNARVAIMIKKGILHEMPSFRKKYNDDQIHALVVYLRTLK